MSNWRYVIVEEIAASTPAAMSTGPFGSAIGAVHFLGRGVPVIRGSNLSSNVSQRLIDQGLVFISPEKATEFERSAARKGDLVFTCWGTINQVGLIDKRAKYEKYIVSNKQMKLTVDPKKADSLFLYYLFSGPEKQSEIINNGIGSSVPGFNLGQLKRHSILLPPLREQHAIAHILGTLDDKVELNRRTNETLEAMARTLFNDWFIDFGPIRAKMEGSKPYLAPNIWSLFPDRLDANGKPEGWHPTVLSDLVELNPTEKLPKGTPAPYVDMASLPTSGSWSEAPVIREFGSGMKFRNGDTLLARITPCLENGKAAFVQNLPKGIVGWGSTEFIVMRPKGVVTPEFVYLLARDAAFRECAIRSMTGTSGRQRAQASVIENYPLLKADERIWLAFAELVRPLFQAIKANAEEAEALAKTRDLLLPKLLSGELRVQDAEKWLGDQA